MDYELWPCTSTKFKGDRDNSFGVPLASFNIAAMAMIKVYIWFDNVYHCIYPDTTVFLA